nr:uncharacterized protein LOC109171487 [Ipomoea batatas]
MSELPESTLYRLQVDAAKLPVSSYRRRGLTYATFQPFEVLDDAADLSNNQLNWTNLFLWNKFGKSLSAADAEAAKHILTIKTVDDKTLAQLQNMAKTLSDEFSEVKKMIQEMKAHSSDLTKLQTAVQNVLHTNNYEAKFYKIESRLDSLEKSVEEITNLTKQIAQRFIEAEEAKRKKKEEERGRQDKAPQEDRRVPRPPRQGPRLALLRCLTPLTHPVSAILEHAEVIDIVEYPAKCLKILPNADPNNYCRFHRQHDHDTD